MHQSFSPKPTAALVSTRITDGQNVSSKLNFKGDMNNKIFKLKGERLNIIYKNLQSSLFSCRRTENRIITRERKKKKLAQKPAC